MLYSGPLCNVSGEPFSLLVLNKVGMMNKVYELLLVVSEMRKGCQTLQLQSVSGLLHAHHACYNGLQAMLGMFQRAKHAQGHASCCAVSRCERILAIRGGADSDKAYEQLNVPAEHHPSIELIQSSIIGLKLQLLQTLILLQQQRVKVLIHNPLQLFG